MEYDEDKNPKHTFLQMRSIAEGPTSYDFTACKKPLASLKEMLTRQNPRSSRPFLLLAPR
jgi:hypothetical protein